MKHTERDIQKACTDLLALDNWRCLRTDPVSDRTRGKGFGELGMPDCLYIRYFYLAFSKTGRASEVLWVEYKSPKGKPKPHQLEWHKRERSRGALTLIAGVDFEASTEGFYKWYFNSGLMQKGLTLGAA